MRVKYKSCTDIGNREKNEDSVGEAEIDGRYCFALADGLGGHGCGEIASRMVVDTALKLFSDNYDEDFLDHCFNKAQENVLAGQKENREAYDMKTTLVTLVIDGDTASWGHIGDSRLYMFYQNRLLERTLDHSVPQMLVNTGEIKEKDIRGHEDRNRLLRVIGSPWGNHAYELADSVTIKDGYVFLLCTDGFWELIEEKRMIANLKKAASVEDWLNRMLSEVKENGCDKDMDNNSVIAVWIED